MHHESKTAPNTTERQAFLCRGPAAPRRPPGARPTLGRDEVLWGARVLPWGYTKEIQYGLACNATVLTSSQGILLQWLCFILVAWCVWWWGRSSSPRAALALISFLKDLMTVPSFTLLITLPLQLWEAFFKIIRWVPAGPLAENQRKPLLTLLDF